MLGLHSLLPWGELVVCTSLKLSKCGHVCVYVQNELIKEIWLSCALGPVRGEFLFPYGQRLLTVANFFKGTCSSAKECQLCQDGTGMSCVWLPLNNAPKSNGIHMYMDCMTDTLGRNLHKRMSNSVLCTQQSSYCNVSVPRDLLQTHTVQNTRVCTVCVWRRSYGQKHCSMMIIETLAYSNFFLTNQYHSLLIIPLRTNLTAQLN